MMWNSRISGRFFLFMVAGLISISCLRQGAGTVKGKELLNGYSSSYPAWNSSAELEVVARSVRKIYSVTTYTTYQFKRESSISAYHLRLGLFTRAAWGIVSTNETVFGTASIIASSGDRLLLLTCAHIVCSPDTLISYFEPAQGDPVRHIRSIAIRDKQEIWVKDLTDCGPFTVLVCDEVADIAFLGKKCESNADSTTVLYVKSGRARALQLGSFIYLLGFPMGNLSVTHGLASPAARRPHGEFTVDALLNKGYSGGILLAHRQGIAGFEMVGMVKNVGMIRDEFLKPASDHPQVPGWMPYNGELFVATTDQIQYGLNNVVTIELIDGFYAKHEEELQKSGYGRCPLFIPTQP